MDASPQSLPKVSVVTVVLNEAAVIERTLRSVCSQDYPQLEFIVVDGQSTDGTLDVIERYRAEITTFVSGRDGGVYAAMNKGAGLSTGEWIVFMNGGDRFVSDDAVSRVIAAVQGRGCDVIYGDGVMNHEGQRLVVQAPDYADLSDGNGFIHQSCFVRGDLQRGYGFDVAERVAADYELFLRLRKDGRQFVHVPVVVAEFFTGGLSTLPHADGIRLRHRVYKRHFPRSDWVLRWRLAKVAAKDIARKLVPRSAWEGFKRLRDKAGLLPPTEN